MKKKTGKMIWFFLVLVLSVAAGISSTESEAARNVKPKRIKIQKTAGTGKGITLTVGEKQKIRYTVLPKKAANKKVVFSSADKKVAKVNAKGMISGLKKGSTTITIKSKIRKTVKAKIKVTVERKVSRASIKTTAAKAQPVVFVPAGLKQAADTTLPMTGVGAGTTPSLATDMKLDQTYLQLAAGESYQLTATVIPVTVTDKVVWTIDYIGGINIYQNGNVFITEDTPVGTTATITAACGKVSATCKVEVVKGACEHVWGAWQTILAPECMVEGISRSECEKCKKIREKAISALGHSWLGKTITQPTCTEVGEMEYTCQRCGDKRIEIVKATGHTWGTNGQIVEAPTCTQKGKIKYTCTVPGCTGEKIELTDALGHTWDAGEITKSPTCTGSGLRTYHCVISGCNGVKREAIDPTGHTWTYGDITQQPTCTTDGSRLCTCLTCSSKMTERIPRIGHSWDNGVVTKAPQCVVPGEKTFTCANCAGKRTESIAVLGHDLGGYQIDVKPTCTQQGRQSRHCKRTGCSYQETPRAVPALGHDEDAGVITTKPNCINPGIKTFTCQRAGCTNKRREIILALGHDWTAGYVISKQPTCTQPGKKSIQCQRTGCGKTKNESSVQPLGHDWDVNNAVKVSPTCTKDGSNTYTCKRQLKNADGSTSACGMQMMEPVPALGHQFAATWTVDIKPTCAVAGQESKHCLNTYTDSSGAVVSCSCVDAIREIVPTGHTWSTWVEKVAPSHGIAGLEERMCSICKLVQDRGKTESHIFDADGNCQNCSQSISLTQTTSKDWEYTLNETEQTILLKKYIGTADCIKIPVQMSVTQDATTKNYAVKFAGKYEKRTQTGVFASNKKCSIRAVSFEDGVKLESMQYMFYGCEELEAVLRIPSGVNDMKGTFEGCTSLGFVGTLPAGITELPDTFIDCKSLVQAPVIPASVKNLNAAFKNCVSLVTAPVLPAGLENFSWTFSGCTALSEAPAIPSTVTEMTNTFEACTSLLKVPEDIPAGVKKLTMTFYGCLGLDTVPEMPSTVETMEYTFKNCANLTYAAPLPKTVTRQVDVFVGCEKLK